MESNKIWWEFVSWNVLTVTGIGRNFCVLVIYVNNGPFTLVFEIKHRAFRITIL